ncbi:MAG: hypothetical protein SCALA702_10620 [Melioribacteraceae bacterium]|nr:MAG: hypothetical protein SCALA702_10620 [Melioribacteraceae bacterium]
MFSTRKILLLLVLLSGYSLPQYVLDSSNFEPIEGVSVSGKTLSTFTDKKGWFDLAAVPDDTLYFSHIGYNTKNLSRREVAICDTIYLFLRNIQTAEVIVSDKKSNNKAISKSVEKPITDEEKFTVKSLSEVITKNSTLIIRDYGGYAGLKTASVRGLSSENTIVLFNEAKVNDIRTGSFDLSLVSPSVLSSVNYSGVSTDEYYGASAGGVLKLSTANSVIEDKLSISLGGGSFGSRKLSTLFQSGSGKINYSLNAERAYAKNDYNYNFLDKTLNRSNSFYSRSFISGNLNYNTSRNSVTLYTHFSSMVNGLPGFVTTNNFNTSKAVNSNKSLLVVVNDHLLLSDNLILRVNVNTHLQSIKYEDPEGKILSVGKIQSSRLTDIGYSAGGIYSVNNLLSLNFGYRGSTSLLSGLVSFTTATAPPEKVSRNESILYSGITSFRELEIPYLNYVKSSILGAYTRIDEKIYAATVDDNLSLNVGIELNLDLMFQPSLVFHYSNDTRIPTFNERYYSGLYDISALKNEEYEVFDIGLEINNSPSLGTFSFYYFHITGKNKIIWVPYLSTLQVPRNINGIDNSGVELGYKNKIEHINTSLNIIYTYTNARNISEFTDESSHGKQLIYTPKHSLKAGIIYSPENFWVSLSFIYTGSRFYTFDNDPFSKLEPHFITDLSASYKLNFWNTGHRLSVSIYNLFDEDYMVIQSYPMPKRTFSINYEIEII